MSIPEEKIDRITPTFRPDQRVVMRQNWLDLLFLHWEFPFDEIQKLLPPGLTADVFDGKAYVGLAPFVMTGVRPAGFPAVPFLSDFLECNVRTYVHFEGRNPGVWFFSLDAANLIAVKVARTLWKLPYYHAKMEIRKSRVETTAPIPNLPVKAPASMSLPGSTVEIAYSTRRLSSKKTDAFCQTRYRVDSDIKPSLPGSLEFFLAERYILYAFSNRLLIGQVNHMPYPLQIAKVDSLNENLVVGAELSSPVGSPLAYYSSGVQVEVFPLRPVN